MSRFLFVSVSLVFAIATLGCTSGDTSNVDLDSPIVTSSDEALGKICGACGDEKGCETCCSENAESCDACGKNAGSALCCVEVDEAAVGKDLCGKCGHVAGAESCCAEGAAQCECGMAKGSPLCCKLEKSDSEGE